MPKLISYLIKNCAELFGANTLTLFDAYLTSAEIENKENQTYEDNVNKLKEKQANKDSGAEESDSLNSLNELNNITNCKIKLNDVNTNLNDLNDLNNKLNDNNLNNNLKNSQTVNSSSSSANLYIKDHLHPLNYQSSQSPTSSNSINTFSSSASYTSNNSANSTPKIYTNNDTNNNCSSNSSSISSTTKVYHRLPTNNNVHQSFYVPMLNQHAVNKVSLSNLSRDSGLTLSDTQLYSPEDDDDEDDYHHIINQHLHLSKKLNSIVSEKCHSNKNQQQFKINSSSKKIANNSTSLKKKCSSKLNRLNTTSSEEDDLHDDLEHDVDIDELSEKSCASENCTPLYNRIYNKRCVSDSHHLITKSAPHLANIEAIGHSIKQSNNNQNKVTCTTTIPLYLHSIKNNSISTNSTSSSCNSPSSSNLSSTSLNLSSSNEYSASDLQRNYFSTTTATPKPQLATNYNSVKNDDVFKQTSHVITISTNENKCLEENNDLKINKTTVCNVSVAPHSMNNQISVKSINSSVQFSHLNKLVNPPPSYQETMTRKEMNARMANLAQSTNLNNSASRKICSPGIDNLISKKIYEQSLRVYNADVHKDLTLRAIPVYVKNQSSDSESSDCDSISKKCSKSIDQIDGHQLDQPIRIKPFVEQRCAKDQTEYWKKDVNWSVATLRNKFTQLCKQNELSSYSINQSKQLKANTCKSTNSIHDLYNKQLDQTSVQTNLLTNCLSQSKLLENNENCVTIIKVLHGQDRLNNHVRSTDSLSGEESYV